MRKYESKESRLALARALAGEAIVLLKNENHTLPLAPGKCIALLGRTQNNTVIGGGGSGASRCDNPLQITDELIKAGLLPEEGLLAFYKALKEKEAAAGPGSEFSPEFFSGLVASGMIYEIFGKYSGTPDETLPEEALFKAASEKTDTAIYVLGRCSGGEECDRHLEGDYLLMDGEKALVALAKKYFSKVIVVLDTNGAVDTSWFVNDPDIQAALFMGSAGEQGAGALSDILTGKTTPSGKLSQTFALSYEDYPTAAHFSWDKDHPDKIATYASYGLSAEENGSRGYEMSPVTVYAEDIYVGYRYFDSFDKQVAYPFGHGISYAKFEVCLDKAGIADGRACLAFSVRNISSTFSGKETVQCYLRAPSGRLERPYQELKGFVKTDCLAPGEEKQYEISFALSEMAAFDEEGFMYVIEPGRYEIRLGTSSRVTIPAAEISVPEEIVVRRVKADIGLTPANRGRISFLKNENLLPACGEDAAFRLTVTAGDVKTEFPVYEGCRFADEDGATAGADAASGGAAGSDAASDGKACADAVSAGADAASAGADAVSAGADAVSGGSDGADGCGAGCAQLADVVSGRVSMEAFISQMSVRELAVLCNGYGPGLPFGGVGVENVTSTIQDENGEDIGYNSHPSAFPGYENPAVKKYGILSACYKDGPASVGDTAWPTGMMLACTFNEALLYEFGSACGYEAEIQHVDAWLAPGMNLIRNPIEGRAFEYFAEDPFLAGECGVAIARGAMTENDISVCPKHFAVNEQETWRRGKTSKNIDAVDSILSARAARELYLKPFEMVITEAKPRVLMTSFNKVNGTFAGGSHVLCTEILRDEWGYDGVVVTDWGDMDEVVDGADAVAAGNDVVMPGGPPVIAQVLKGYEEGRVTLAELRTAVAHLMNFVKESKSFKDQ